MIFYIKIREISLENFILGRKEKREREILSLYLI